MIFFLDFSTKIAIIYSKRNANIFMGKILIGTLYIRIVYFARHSAPITSRLSLSEEKAAIFFSILC